MYKVRLNVGGLVESFYKEPKASCSLPPAFAASQNIPSTNPSPLHTCAHKHAGRTLEMYSYWNIGSSWAGLFIFTLLVNPLLPRTGLGQSAKVMLCKYLLNKGLIKHPKSVNASHN
jgi:hypothetical protein